MASLGGIGSSGKAVGKQPSKDGSGSGGSDNDVDDKVTTGRGSDVSGNGTRRGSRQRKMSANGAEAVANGMSEREFLAQAAAAFDKARTNNSSSAPSTILAPGGGANSSSSLPLSSLLLPSAPVIGNNVSSLAAAAASQPHQLHGINTARAAHSVGSGVDTKSAANTAIPLLPPSIDDRSSGERERRHRRRSSHRHRREASLSPSSSSSDDELTHGHHSLYYNGQRIKPRHQWHLSAIRNMRTRYTSFTALFEDAKVANVRNKFEGAELAAVLDQLMITHDHINQPHITMNHVARARVAVNVAMELAVRRLQGVISADTTGGDWSCASSLSLIKHAKLGNDDLERHMSLDVTRTRTANKSNNNNNNNNGNGRGNGGNDRGRRQQRGGGSGGGGRGKGGDSAKSSSNDTNGNK